MKIPLRLKKIVCFHLYNDYSGSPKVLHDVLYGFAERHIAIDLFTSKGEGALSELSSHSCVNVKYYSYKYSEHKIATLLRYIFVQVYTFFYALRYCRRDVVFYINTILPVGPALAGKMMGKRVIYHYHENAFAKGAFYQILAWVMQRIATKIVCVSQYQASFLRRKAKVCIIPNAPTAQFVNALKPDADRAFQQRTVLMLSSLKEYKGTWEFVTLSAMLPQYNFVLVVNDTEDNINQYLRMQEHGLVIRGCCGSKDNLTIYSRQPDVSQFYNNASIVLSLTNKKKFLETFGLTALEAMCAGLPLIVPTVGGIAEMVEDGENGYKIDVQDLPEIATAIQRILDNYELYKHLSQCSLAKSKRYGIESAFAKLQKVIDDY